MLPSAAETRGNSTASLPLLQHTGICGTCTIALRSKPSLPPHVHLQVRFWGPRSPETRMLESLENRRVPLVTSPHAVASSGVTLRVRLWKRRIKRGLLRPSSRKRWDIFNLVACHYCRCCRCDCSRRIVCVCSYPHPSVVCRSVNCVFPPRHARLLPPVPCTVLPPTHPRPLRTRWRNQPAEGAVAALQMGCSLLRQGGWKQTKFRWTTLFCSR